MILGSLSFFIIQWTTPNIIAQKAKAALHTSHFTTESDGSRRCDTFVDPIYSLSPILLLYLQASCCMLYAKSCSLLRFILNVLIGISTSKNKQKKKEIKQNNAKPKPKFKKKKK